MPSFAELSREFLDAELADSPVRASQLGLTEYDAQLDDLSEAAFERRRRTDASWLGRFRETDAGALSFDEAIDRDLVISTLDGRRIVDDFEMWRRQPDTYLNPGLTGIFTLFLHRLRPMPELVDAAISRLRLIPGNLEDGKRNLRPELVPAIFLERAANQARAGARYVRELLPAQVEDPDLAAKLAEAGDATASAYESYVAFLEEMKPSASGEWALGEDRYSALLREKELLGFDARELRERGRAAYDELAAELTRCARELRGTDDWKSVLDELNEDHPTHAGGDAHRLRGLDRARPRLPARARPGELPGRRGVRRRAVTAVPAPGPGRRELHAAAAVQRSDARPLLRAVPARRGERGRDPEAARVERLRRHPDDIGPRGLPRPSLAPGDVKANPSRLRQAYRTPYFSEGWALYAERMMREQGFFTDLRHEMYQYEATIFRAARIVVDTSLHMGEMSWDEAVAFMTEHTALTEPTAKAEVTRYCAWPTQASSYLTGCLEIVRIRDAFFAAHGSSGTDALRAFHDGITSSGGLPIALAERAVLAVAQDPAQVGRSRSVTSKKS